MLASMENRLRRWLYGRDLAVWHAPEYRWPLSALETRTGARPRRADFTVWFLLERRALGRANLRRPRRAEYEELARVHTPELLDSLGQAETLARIFSVDPTDVPVDETMYTVRLACGATIGAAREVLSALNLRSARRCALNLLGGFHHARPDVAGGFCPVNDVAVAIAAVRADGFSRSVGVARPAVTRGHEQQAYRGTGFDRAGKGASAPTLDVVRVCGNRHNGHSARRLNDPGIIDLGTDHVGLYSIALPLCAPPRRGARRLDVSSSSLARRVLPRQAPQRL